MMNSHCITKVLKCDFIKQVTFIQSKYVISRINSNHALNPM